MENRPLVSWGSRGGDRKWDFTASSGVFLYSKACRVSLEGALWITGLPSGADIGPQKAPLGTTMAQKGQKSVQWRPKVPKRSPKARFWEPQGSHFQGKLPRVLSCENISICYGLSTSRRVRSVTVGTKNHTSSAYATQTSFFHDFFAFKGAPGAPKGRKASPRATQRLPRDT